MIPDIVWMWLAEHMEPNPMRYIDLCQVCRSSYYIFTGDRLWNKVSPFKCEGAYDAFYKRVQQLSEDKADILVDLWLDPIRNTLIGIEYEQEHAHIHTSGDVAFAYACWKGRQCKGQCQRVSGPFHDREFTLACVRLHPCLILSAPAYWNDKEVLREAIEGNGHFPVRKVPVNDPELGALLIKKHPSYVLRAPPELQTTANFLAALKQDPYQIMAAPIDVRRDRALVMAVVERNGELLELAADELKRDRGVVMAAVTNTGMALQFALIKTRDIVLQAITVGGGAPIESLGEFVQDVEVARQLVDTVPQAMDLLPQRIQNNLRGYGSALHAPNFF